MYFNNYIKHIINNIKTSSSIKYSIDNDDFYK